MSFIFAVDSQGTSQNSMQRAKRKGRAEAAAKSKRSSRPPEDMLMSQMGCSQQVTALTPAHSKLMLWGFRDMAALAMPYKLQSVPRAYEGSTALCTVC